MSTTMFDNFYRAKTLKLPPWAGPLLAGSAVFVALLIAAMWVKTIWAIELLDKPKVSNDFAVAPAPPPPPPPPPGGHKPQTQVIQPKKRTVKDLVQPVKVEKQEKKEEDKGDPAGEEGGVEGGVAGGVQGGDLNGVVGAPPPPPPPPPPPGPPVNVAPTMLEGQRIAGEKLIVPDDVTKTDIQRSGKDKIITSYKLCIDTGGNVTSVSTLKTSGYPPYDQKIHRTIKNEWRYRPYAVNGKVVPVCTAVTFIYSQK